MQLTVKNFDTNRGTFLQAAGPKCVKEQPSSIGHKNCPNFSFKAFKHYRTDYKFLHYNFLQHKIYLNCLHAEEKK